MAISEAYSGTETVSTTEWDLASDTSFVADVVTDDGVYQIFLDLNALAAGDVFEFRLYEKVLSSSTQRLAYSAAFAGPQAMPVWVSPSLILLHGWAATLIKISGTDRSIDWSIRKVA
jgi:hypothetical protein